MSDDAIRLRLLHPGGDPLAFAGQPFTFGLQNAKGELDPGRALGGGLAFDFQLRVKPGRDAEHPAFLGAHASGPAQDRFVYLSWRSTRDGTWINRVKARLSPITWAMVREANARGVPLVCDMTGRRPHDTSPTVWRVG